MGSHVWFVMIVLVGVWLVPGSGCDRPADAGAVSGPAEAPPGSDEGRNAMEKATFGAGCFWGVEQAFRQVHGVMATQVGYAGGTVENPTYRQVCSHTTGHAEVVEVTYDPALVTYEALLELFWRIHDPTTLNRQGPDIGDQYRSVIFYHTDEQRAAAEASKQREDASGKHRQPIVTQIEPAPRFWPAEEYHQQYFEKRGGGSCRLR